MHFFTSHCYFIFAKKRLLLSPFEEVPFKAVQKLHHYRQLIAVHIARLNIFHVDPDLKNEESSIQLKNFLELHSKERFYNELMRYILELKLPFTEDTEEKDLDTMLIQYDKKFGRRRKRKSRDWRKEKEREVRKKLKKFQKNDENSESSEEPVEKRKRVKWTEKESLALLEGVQKFGVGEWSQILDHYKPEFHKNRRTRDLRVRWRYVKDRLLVNSSQDNNNMSTPLPDPSSQNLIEMSQDKSQEKGIEILPLSLVESSELMENGDNESKSNLDDSQGFGL